MKNSKPIHLFCVEKSITFQNLKSKEIFEAIVCGKNLTLGTETLQTFMALGLIHILVVSGSHFTTLHLILSKVIKSSQVFIVFILLLYCSMTLFQPPAGRAFVSFALEILNDRYRLSFPTPHLEVFSGIVCLALFPEWVTSLSFHLSWSLSLLLCLFGNSKEDSVKYVIFKLFAVQGFASLLVGSFGQLSLISNFIIAPFFSIFLFPFGLLIFVCPQKLSIFSQIWDFLIPQLLKPLEVMAQNSSVINMPLTWSETWWAVSSLILVFFTLSQSTVKKET